jgi:predicted phosphoribosyltransferase
MTSVLDTGRLFRDRIDAGRQLAERLEVFRKQSPVVFAIPRGGIPVGAEVARRLDTELEVIVARKLGAPFQPELAIGAVTADGERILNQDMIGQLPVSASYLDQVTKREVAEARRREQRFRGNRPVVEVKGRTIILVDDGLATGATMRAAARSLRKRGPGRLVVAVPVGSRDACWALLKDSDEVVCLAQPEPFYAIGLYYDRFEQVEDTEVLRLLKEEAAVKS